MKVLVLKSFVFIFNTDMDSFQTNTTSKVKNICKFVSLLKVISENNINVIYCRIKWWQPHFLISKTVFHWFLLNFSEFVHETSQTPAIACESVTQFIGLFPFPFIGLFPPPEFIGLFNPMIFNMQIQKDPCHFGPLLVTLLNNIVFRHICGLLWWNREQVTRDKCLVSIVQ